MSPVDAPPLAEVLQQAAMVWRLFRAGQSLDRAIAAVVDKRPNLRPAVQDASYSAVRHLAASERIIERLSARTPARDVAALLAVSLAQLQSGRYGDHVVVDQAVSAARSSPKTRAASGFVNALLRTFVRERESLLADLRVDEVVHYNLPRWWIERLQRAYPPDWKAIAESQQQPPPLVLRVNTSRLSVDAYLRTLQDLGISAMRVGPQALWMHEPRPVSAIPGFSAGDVSIQDGGAQLAASWLDARPGMRVLDACAAPGGKTAHLAELGATDLTALEVDPDRALRIEENLRRIGVAARIVIGDARQPDTGVLYERILLDAPCTASGIVRRHADIPWLRRPTDVAQLTTVQRELLDALWPLLTPGGRLLYVVCSLFPEEGREQINRFLERRPDARQVPLPAAQLLPTSTSVAAWQDCGLPTLHDGFFYALLEKTR
ncbi:MAG: 16S rRNA (cytosine(967)-C(5))-methyltransferase RsmB [Burkholderiaceae bacterium]